MRNRAKCKLCQNVIESFHKYDYVTCGCGEISITGGLDELSCSAKNFDNFLRVDDQGNEVMVKVIGGKEKVETIELQPILTRKERIEMLDAMIKNIENLPQNAMTLPINHYDFYSFMLLVSSILKTE